MVEQVGAPKDAAAAAALQLLPQDAILVHIGVHKTGTTALQADLRRSRSTLGLHGLALPTSTVGALAAGQALVGVEVTWDPTATPHQRRAMWNTFASDVAAEPGRLIVSSEPLCQAGNKQAKRLVDDLGPSRVHLLVAFRPLATLLPSTWQQFLKGGKHWTYEEWLSGVLAEPRRTMRPITFWKRNDVAAQLARWSELIGADRVTAVVIDGRADVKVRRCIENLQGLPPGLLDPPPDPDRSNRSLSVAEAEMLRQINMVASQSLSSSEYVRLVREGAVRRMVESRRPGPDEGRIGLPEWAVPLVRELGQQQADALRASGVHVVGDPDLLAQCSASEDSDDGLQLPTEAATLALLGALEAGARLARKQAKAAGTGPKGTPRPRTSVVQRARSRLGSVARALESRVPGR